MPPQSKKDDPSLADLNEPQRQAVTHRDGPLLVIAGPGSGKTRVITRRAAHLVQSGVPPWKILAITFTNKAADEMKRRIEALGVAGGMWIYTFHALGVRLLREFGPLGRVRPGFVIYDEADQLRCIKDALELCKIGPDSLRPEAAQAKISTAKNRLIRPAEYLARENHFENRIVGRAYEAYEQLLEQRNAVDFDDLLMRVAIVLRDHPDVTDRLNERFKYLLIDEYQDTNHAQYLIAKLLSRGHRNICATGDPDQSIYGWRGADISNILDFERDYPEAVVVRLEQNYRSTGSILKAASRLIRGNRRRKHKDLWTEKGDGDALAVWQFPEDREEAEQIAETILKLKREGRAYGDVAIMYRINALSRGLEEALRLRGIPYKIARGVEFYNRKEIRDTLAYLRLLVNPDDEVALLRILNTPPRGIGKTTIARLISIADRRGAPLMEILRDADNVPGLKPAAAKSINAFVSLIDTLTRAAAGSVADVVSETLAQSGLEALYRSERIEGGEDRSANLAELVNAAKRYEDEIEQPTLEDFLQRVALTSDQDAVDESAGVVMLMTLHAAKGLEFPVVMMVGVEEGMLPHERALQEGDLEEERRLCFVGITRARERLYLTYACQRLLRGALMPRNPSQFLGELPDEVIDWTDFGKDGAVSVLGKQSYVPLDDQLPPEDLAPVRRRSRKRPRLAADPDDEPVFSPNDPTSIAKAPPAASPYAGWTEGTLVRHELYGVGLVEWIRPQSGQTRASIRFAGYGQKTFILELAPVSKLERK